MIFAGIMWGDCMDVRAPGLKPSGQESLCWRETRRRERWMMVIQSGAFRSVVPSWAHACTCIDTDYMTSPCDQPYIRTGMPNQGQCGQASTREYGSDCHLSWCDNSPYETYVRECLIAYSRHTCLPNPCTPRSQGHNNLRFRNLRQRKFHP